MLDKILKARKYFAYGEQIDYFYDESIIGFVRQGDYEHSESGLAVVMSDRDGGELTMNVGKKFANTVFVDYLGNREDKIFIDSEGNGNFMCNGRKRFSLDKRGASSKLEN